MIIDYKQLSEHALNGLIESFVLEQDFDSSDDSSLEDKAHAIKTALKTGELVVTFSELHETAHIKRADELNSVDERDEQS